MSVTVKTFMYAENAVQILMPNNEQKLQISGPLLVMQPQYVPGTFSFFIVFGLIGFDLSVNHKLKLIFKNEENGKELMNTDDIVIGPIPKDTLVTLPIEMQGFSMSMGCQNVNFENDGVYTTEIYFDNEKLDEFPIQVKKKELKI